MARMLSLQRNRFKATARWLDEDLPRAPENAKVWSAFVGTWPLNESHARETVSSSGDPIIYVEALPGFSGIFDPAKPKTVTIATALVERFEAGPEGSDREKLEAAVLHEFVHWAWALAKKKEDEEKGNRFEREAYGKIVTQEPDPPSPDELGLLSRNYESNGRPWAIGADTNGGWSYGLYQLSSRQGTLSEFIRFLSRAGGQSDHVKFAETLQAAGGDAAARAGQSSFKTAWQSLAQDTNFSKAQHAFIRETHYEPFVKRLLAIGIDVAQRSHALRDVAWSTSVQHGPGRTSIFQTALGTLSVQERLDDAAVIGAVYDERSKVDVYFKKSSLKERAAVRNRFLRERERALQMLQQA